jgi:hypothetical protein
MLQTGRSRDHSFLSIELILPAALWPCSRLNLQRKWIPGIFRGVKSDWHVRLTSPSVSRLSRKCRNSGLGLLTIPWTSAACYRDSFTLQYTYHMKLHRYFSHPFQVAINIHFLLHAMWPVCLRESFNERNCANGESKSMGKTAPRKGIRYGLLDITAVSYPRIP